MARIRTQDASIVFPMVGSDHRFMQKLQKQSDRQAPPVGGHIIVEEDRPVGVLALDHINLELNDGDRLGLVGHNGSGKSTLLRMLGGIYPPTSGTVEIEGKVTAMFSLSLGVNKEASGLDNIFLKGLMHGLKRREVQSLLPEIAEFSELGDYLHLPMKTYSSGMTMRLLFSIASAFRPDILLLDEWVSAGDKAFKEKVDQRLNAMLETVPIVIIASHNEKRVSEWANRMIRLERGVAHFEPTP